MILINFIFILYRFAHPITFGDYPDSMRSLVGNRLPKFTKEQSAMLKGSLDFLGLNYYTTNYAESIPLKATGANLSYTDDRRVSQTSMLNFLCLVLIRVYLTKYIY